MDNFAISMSKDFQDLIAQTKDSAFNPAKTSGAVIQRAVAVYVYLLRQLETNPGSKVCIVNDKDEIVEIIDLTK